MSLQGGRLVVRVSAAAGQRAVRAAVDEWFHVRARDVFGQRVLRLQREIAMLAELTPRLHVRRMTRRWGSCSGRGTITMNPALMQAPPSCIDYVLVHELLHLLEPAHSRRFYTLLDRAMQDWRSRKQRLASAAVRWG